MDLHLPYGITGGYYQPLKEKKPPSINKNEFYSKCKEIASKKQIKCEILSSIEEVAFNFCAVKFFCKPNPVYALINEAHPFLAFCLSDDWGDILGPTFPLHFIDNEDLAKEFGSYYRVMKVKDLQKPFILKEHKELKNIPSIIEQVEYWNPQTVGDVIYNPWD
ncbi:MAG: hypothetical protein ACQEXQ_06635 [Bacillota bacterium]